MADSASCDDDEVNDDQYDITLIAPKGWRGRTAANRVAVVSAPMQIPGQRRVLVTDADDFVGPATVERFGALGDQVVTVTEPITERSAAQRVLDEQGPFDVVVVNLDLPIPVGGVTELSDEQWRGAHERLVDPLFWWCATCLGPMIEAGSGAIVVPTSATALRQTGFPIVAYQTARSAQVAMVAAIGAEMAPHGVRVNAIAPNYVENPSYYPPELVADERFQAAVRRDVPSQRLGSGGEAAAVIEWLASDAASYVFGAVIPVDGGWSL